MNHNSFAALALGALCTLSTPAFAQEANPSATVNLDFKGGRMSELIAALRAASDRVNIVAPDLGASVSVPAMQLRDVTVESALRAAASVVEGPYDIDIQPIRSGPGDLVFAVRIRELTKNVQAVGGASGSSAAEKIVQVFSLRMLTKQLPGEPESVILPTTTVLTAIDTGLAIVDTKARPTIKYHEDSGLLFVSGNPDHLMIVQSVLRQLETSVQQTRAAIAQQHKATAAEPSQEAGAAKGKEQDKKPVR